MKLTQRYRQLNLWSKVAFWGSVCSILGFLYLFFPSSPSALPQRATPSGPSAGTASSREQAALSEFASLEAYRSNLARFEGRFAERDEFERKVVGLHVSRLGTVRDVRERGNTVSIYIDSTNQSSHASALAEFPSSFSARLFALRKGDIIRVEGAIQKSEPTKPWLAATNFTLESP